MDFYTHYAKLKDGKVVEYPVNPRTFLLSTNDYNIPFNWQGGNLGEETYVFCHNQEPEVNYTEIFVETTPYFDSQNNVWYRGYEKKEASPELILERVNFADKMARQRIATLLDQYSNENELALGLSDEQKIDWQNFRSELATVLTQQNYPMQITWPAPPDSLENAMKIGVVRI